MKRFACKTCDSPDLMEQDGVFVCPSCGCRYSVEEAVFYPAYHDACGVGAGEIGIAAKRMADTLESVLERIGQKFEHDLAAVPSGSYHGIIETAIRTKNRARLERIYRDIVELHTLLIQKAIAHAGDSTDSIYRAIDEWIVPSCELLLAAGDGLIGHFQEYDLALKAYQLVLPAEAVVMRTAAGAEMAARAKARIAETSGIRAQRAQKEATMRAAEIRDELSRTR